MNEAPKKIWVDAELDVYDYEEQGTQPYIRADIVDELVKALSTANDLIKLNRAMPRISTAVQEHVQAVLDAMKEEK